MDSTTAEGNGFSVGDRATVLAGAIPATFTIVGIAEFATTGSPGGASFAERVIMLKDGEVASDMEDPSQDEIISMVTSLSDI